MKEMCTRTQINNMSKTGKSNYQMLTLAMAEFSSVDLGSMAASSFLHSTGTYIGDINHSAVHNRQSEHFRFTVRKLHVHFLQIQDNRPVEIGVEYACFSTLSQSPILISGNSGQFTMECNIDDLRGIK